MYIDRANHQFLDQTFTKDESTIPTSDLLTVSLNGLLCASILMYSLHVNGLKNTSRHVVVHIASTVVTGNPGTFHIVYIMFKMLEEMS